MLVNDRPLGAQAASAPMRIDPDQRGWAICSKLAAEFGVPVPFRSGTPGPVSIGIEVEVPFSSYFPQIWARFRLAERGVSGLDTFEMLALNEETSAAEFALLPLLHRTVKCGIPRGNDRYWEFSLRPVFNGQILADQVSMLTAVGALPRDRRHALHVTLGSLIPSKSLYHLAMLLELHFVTPERIRDGLSRMRSPIHAGWGRKGLAGIYGKGPSDLQDGASLASELRILELPPEDSELRRLMASIQWCAGAIFERGRGSWSAEARAWQLFDDQIPLILADHGLSDVNWFKSGPGGGVDHLAWETYIHGMPALLEEVRHCMPPAMLAVFDGKDLTDAKIAG